MSIWPRYSSQKTLQQAHRSHIRMREKDFDKFRSRFERKVGGKVPNDIDKLLTTIVEGQRKKVYESISLRDKRRKQRKEEDKTEDPFAGFATIESLSFNHSDPSLFNSSVGSAGANSLRSIKFKAQYPKVRSVSIRKSKRASSLNQSQRSSGVSYRSESIDYQMDNLVEGWE